MKLIIKCVSHSICNVLLFVFFIQNVDLFHPYENKLLGIILVNVKY